MKRILEIGMAVVIASCIGFLKGENIDPGKACIIMSVANIIFSIVLAVQSAGLYVSAEAHHKFCEPDCNIRYYQLFSTLIATIAYAILELRWLRMGFTDAVGDMDTLAWLLQEFAVCVALYFHIQCLKKRIRISETKEIENHDHTNHGAE